MSRIDEMKGRFNGCPLFEKREKGKVDDLEGKVITIDEYFELNGDEGNYFAFTIAGDDKHFYLSGGAITALLSEFGDEATKVEIKIGAKVKTKAKRDYRPITIM